MSLDVTALAIKIESVGIKEASQALGGLSTSAANAEKRISTFTKAMEALNIMSATSANTMNSYMQKMAQQATMMQALNVNAQGAAASTAALASAMALLAASLNTLQSTTAKAAAQQNIHNESMKEAHALARGLSGSLGALWVTYGNFAGMAVGLAIGASLKGIVSVGKEVESTLEGIRVRGEETVASVNAMRESILNLGRGVFGPLDVAKAFDVMTLAGLRAEESLVGIHAVLNLALIGGTSLEKSAEVLVQVSTALGYSAAGFDRIGDVISKTAAVSISSVSSLSESFKAASVVGKLYGQSLVDIGTELAILSNLGIKGTAAGTATKNFFSDLASGSEKVTRGLKILNLTIDDLKDKQGNFRPFVEVMKTLAGDSEKGFNSLTAASQKLAQSLITNERGNKLMTEGLSMVRKEGEQTASALEDIAKRINESWGFQAQGAAAMALTIDAQFKSVKNTLETTFVKAFDNIQPQLSLVATSLKAAFNSNEFSSNLQSIALGVARFTVALVENAGVIWEVIRAILAWKAAAAVFGILVSIAEGVLALKAALDLAKVSAIAFQASLGLIGLALAAGAAALVWWATKRDEAFSSDKTKAALNYMDDFKSKLDEESSRLEKQIILMEKGKKAVDAYTESLQQQQLQKIKEQGTVAIDEATKNLEKTWNGLQDFEKKAILEYKKGIMPGSSDFAVIDAINRMGAATKALNVAKETTKKKEDDIQASLQRSIDANKKLADLAEIEAKKRNQVPEGTGLVPPKADKAAINDAYAAAIIAQDDLIRASKKELRRYEEEELSAFKAGQIGRLRLIQEVGTAEIAALNKQMEATRAKIAEASNKKNSKAETKAFEDELEAEQVSMNAARLKMAEDTNNQLAKYAVENTKTQVAELEAQGKYAEAASLKFSSEYSTAFKQAKKDVKDYGNAYPSVIEYVSNLTKLQDQMFNKAKFKEAIASFDMLASSLRNTLKSATADSKNQDFGAMWKTATTASKQYEQELDTLKAKQQELAFAAFFSGSDEDMKKANEAAAQITVLTENFRTMWASVADSIGNGMEKAFGRGGKALNELFKVTNNLSKDQGKTFTGQMKYWGDMAEAAEGFFDKQSKGYKVMHAASQAFHAAEMALAIAGMIPKIAAGAATMFAQSGWGGFAGVAAMMVLLAGLGYSGSSSGGISAADMQKSQGTGTVFGDSSAKSDSIQHSIKLLEAHAKDLIPLNVGMLLALRNIEASMVGLTNLFVRTPGLTDASNMGIATGRLANGSAPGLNIATSIGKAIGGPLSGIIGDIGAKLNSLWGGTKQNIVDSGIQFGGNVGDLQSGKGYNQYASVDTTKSSFFGLVKHTSNSVQTQSLSNELTSQLGSIFTNLETTLKGAAKALGGDADAVSKALEQLSIPETKLSLKGLTGQALTDALNAVISSVMDTMSAAAFPELDSFRKVGEGYTETVVRLASDYAALDRALQSTGDSFGAVGMSSLVARERLIDLAGGIDNLTQNTSDFAQSFLTKAQQLAPVQKYVTEQLTSMGLAGIKTREQFAQVVLGIDKTTQAGAEQYTSLMALQKAFALVTPALEDFTKTAEEIATERKGLQDQLDELTMTSTQLLMKQRNALDESNRALFDQVQAAKTAADATIVNKNNLEQAYQRESTALQSVVDKFKTFSEALKKFKSSLLTGDLSTLSPEQKYLETKNRFLSTSAKADTGDEKALGDLQQVSQDFLDASRGYNASTEAYAADFNLVTKGLDRGAAAADVQVFIAQSQLDVMKMQYSALVDIKAVMSFKDAVTAATGGGNVVNGQVWSADELAGKVWTEKDMGKTWMDHHPIGGNLEYSATAMPFTYSGSHYDGLDSVPHDGYIAKLHANERVQSSRTVAAQDRGMEQLVDLTGKVLEKLCNIEEMSGADKTQRAAIAEESAMHAAEMKEAFDAFKRKLAAK